MGGPSACPGAPCGLLVLLRPCWAPMDGLDGGELCRAWDAASPRSVSAWGSLGRPVKSGLLCPTPPPVSGSGSLGRSLRICIPPSSQVVLLLDSTRRIAELDNRITDYSDLRTSARIGLEMKDYSGQWVVHFCASRTPLRSQKPGTFFPRSMCIHTHICAYGWGPQDPP